MECTNSDRLIAVAGIVIGCLIAFWQWHDAKIKGDRLEHFLLGLKSAELSENVKTQVNNELMFITRPWRWFGWFRPRNASAS